MSDPRDWHGPDAFPPGMPVFDVVDLNAEQNAWLKEMGQPHIIERREVCYFVDPTAEMIAEGTARAAEPHVLCVHEPVVSHRGKLRVLTFYGDVQTLPHRGAARP